MGEGDGVNSKFKGIDLPVEQVSWNDCFGDSDSFCKKLGLKLPTEAQWEYACRAGKSTPFSFGSNITTGQVNYDGHYPYNGGSKGVDRKKTVAVDSFLANGFGLFNMHGNVFEWCEDVYDSEYYSKSQAKNGDIPCTSGSNSRVFRGGCWVSFAWACRSALRGNGPKRFALTNSGRDGDFGFRPSRPLP